VFDRIQVLEMIVWKLNETVLKQTVVSSCSIRATGIAVNLTVKSSEESVSKQEYTSEE